MFKVNSSTAIPLIICLQPFWLANSFKWRLATVFQNSMDWYFIRSNCFYILDKKTFLKNSIANASLLSMIPTTIFIS
jgi:hypothetical protein